MRRIVVGVDQSPASTAALRWAITEAQRRSATLIVVHAYLAPLAYTGTQDDVARIDPELHEAVAGRLEGFIADARSELDAVEIVPRLHPGRAHDGLLTEARVAGTDLLVVGSRGAGGFEGLLLGATAEQCLRRSPCPVVVVPVEPPRGTALVVGVDGSPHAEQALAWAVEQARQREASVQVVGVYQPYDAPGPFGGDFLQLADPGAPERFRREAERHVAEAVAAVAESEIELSTVVRAGHPARVLIECGRSAALVVLGRGGRPGPPQVTLGSVTRQVLHHAPCPVAIVPGSAAH